MGRKILEILKWLKDAWGILTALGVSATAIFTFFTGLPAWFRFGLAGLAVAALSSVTTVYAHRYKVVRPLLERAERNWNMFSIVKTEADRFNDAASGKAWPPHRALLFALPPANEPAMNVVLTPTLAVLVEFDIEVFNFAPFPVRIVEFDISYEIQCFGDFSARETLLKRTGWDGIPQRGSISLRVKQRIPVEKLPTGLVNVRIGVSGHAVVAAEEWEGEQRVTVSGFVRSLVRDRRRATTRA